MKQSGCSVAVLDRSKVVNSPDTLRNCCFAKGITIASRSRDHGKTQLMRPLKLIAALAAAALIIGQVGTARRVASEPKTDGMPVSLNVEPLQVLVRACGDCHSNHTDWPWYSHVPPVSGWIAQRQGKVGFFGVGQLFAMAKARQVGIHLRTYIDWQDAALAVHHDALRSETHRKGQESSLCLGKGRSDRCKVIRKTRVDSIISGVPSDGLAIGIGSIFAD
jgi:hypothetical protein